jgi:glutamate-5-semialdehyde dehydrogenase
MAAAGSLDKKITALARRSRAASARLAEVRVAALNRALRTMARLLKENAAALQRENAKDLDAARAKGLSSAMIDRLTLSDKTIASMISGLKVVAGLPSPVGERFENRTRPNGLKIYKVRAPIGVIGIIYESRPNVTIDAAAICLKSQNAVILRGGSESYHSNTALAALFGAALTASDLPADSVQLIPTTDRAAVELMLKQESYIDLVIPRGGEGLIRMVVDKSRIPVIKHYKGVCHVYISANADREQARAIAVNAKAQRPGVCNAMETLLIDQRLPKRDRAALLDALLDAGVKVYGDPAVKALHPAVKKASRRDWEAEYLDLRLAVRQVAGLDEAIEHINAYGSHHTDAIVSRSKSEIAEFITRVDSSSVIVNASTRFSDGGEYGMGCEIGISTDKLHARGPMGVADLTTYKWVVEGRGHIRG